MNLQALTNRLNKLGGFDLSDSEARDLLNEGLRDLAAAARFPRKVWQFGSTPGQQLYSLPGDFVSAEWVQVDSRVLVPGTELDAARFENGSLSLGGPGIWFLSGAGDQLGLWPIPGDLVSDVVVEYVARPAALLLGSDEPLLIPEEFHPALTLYAAAQYYGFVEDNPELETRYLERYGEQVQRLKQFGVARAGGSKPFSVGIVGYTV